MSEPDDVERLVAEIESVVHADPASLLRLARIVRELLAEYVTEQAQTECTRDEPLPGVPSCDDPAWRCGPCQARALRERLNKIARGEA